MELSSTFLPDKYLKNAGQNGKSKKISIDGFFIRKRYLNKKIYNKTILKMSWIIVNCVTLVEALSSSYLLNPLLVDFRLFFIITVAA